MKTQQKLVLPLFALIILASLSIEALASCPRLIVGPACQEFWRTDVVVFTAVATKVVRHPNNKGIEVGPYLGSTVHFSIEEAFKGIEGTEVVIDLTYCGYSFNEGQRYLVFAHRDSTNKLFVYQDSNTRPLAEAGEDLKYIRGASAEESGTRVFGKVHEYNPNRKEGRWDRQPLVNIKVTLEGNGQRQEVVTNSEGSFEFKRLPAGTYEVRAELPDGFRHNREIVRAVGRGCAWVDVIAVPKKVP